MSNQNETSDSGWTPADEFECPVCDKPLVEIWRCAEEMPGPYGPLLPAVFICAAGHHTPVTTTPGYADAFDRWHIGATQ